MRDFLRSFKTPSFKEMKRGHLQAVAFDVLGRNTCGSEYEFEVAMNQMVYSRMGNVC